jgi:hypothetical protein
VKLSPKEISEARQQMEPEEDHAAAAALAQKARDEHAARMHPKMTTPKPEDRPQWRGVFLGPLPESVH